MTEGPFPPLKLSGRGHRYIFCPGCGRMLDKQDLAGLLAHEERCAEREKK